jgi:hypothetical protein
MPVAGSSAGQTRTNCRPGPGRRSDHTIEDVERSTKLVLGPLFTIGVALVGIGAVRRSLRLIAAGAAAIVADQRLPAARRLKDRLRKHTPQA